MKRRQLVHVAQIHPTSFVLLFEKGMTGSSWSVRDYSQPGRVSVRYAAEFGLTLSEIRETAMRNRVMFDAPTVATSNLDYWHGLTTGYNRRYLQRTTAVSLPNSPEPVACEHTGLPSCYPLLGSEGLKNHPKWSKRHDRERILLSGRSEDWVTWNAFTLLTSASNSAWWQRLLSLAQKSNSGLKVVAEWLEIPEVRLWESVASPTGYELASRARMRCSREPRTSSTQPQSHPGRRPIRDRHSSIQLSIARFH
jgi:hypothetical protein